MVISSTTPPPCSYPPAEYLPPPPPPPPHSLTYFTSHSCCSNHQVQEKNGQWVVPRKTILLLASMHSDKMSTTWGNSLLGTWHNSLWCMMSAYVVLETPEKRKKCNQVNSEKSAWESWM